MKTEKNGEKVLLCLEAFSTSDKAGKRNKISSCVLRTAEMKCLFD